jgi:hypothetical protein
MTTRVWLVAFALAAPAAAIPQVPSQREEPEESVPADAPAAAEPAPARDEEAEDRAEQARVAARARELATNPPTEAKLGVPIYPGARFDPETTAGMSEPGAGYFVFFSADPVDQVTRFYEQRTGKKAERTPGGSMIAVKGSLPWPELGVTVQPNAFAEGWRKAMKSLVTVRKAGK